MADAAVDVSDAAVAKKREHNLKKRERQKAKKAADAASLAENFFWFCYRRCRTANTVRPSSDTHTRPGMCGDSANADRDLRDGSQTPQPCTFF